jgi:hypothetical protein
MKKQQLFDFLKSRRGASIDDIAKQLEASRDFVLGMIQGDSTYVQRNNYLRLSGLGKELCIVCAESMMPHTSYSVSLPMEMQREHQLPKYLQSGIWGHRKCYDEKAVVQRYDGFYCNSCTGWYGAWVDGDEVQEKCRKLGMEENGHPGVIASKRMCTHFSLGSKYHFNIEDESDEAGYRQKEEKWEQMKEQMDCRRQKAYENLVGLLEEAYIIEPKTVHTS